MQTIKTYYLPATNYKGSRIKAIAEAGSVTLSWDDALNVDGNHEMALRALCKKVNWTGRKFAHSSLRDGTRMWSQITNWTVVSVD